MSVKSMAHAASRGVSRQVFTVKQHSPVLLLGVGVVGFVSTCALSIRATLKLSDVLDEAEKEVAEAQTEIDRLYNSVPDENERDKKSYEKSRQSVASKTKLQTAIKIARLYAPAVAVGAVSVAALTGSHVILQRRNTGLIAAYAAVDSMFKQYRNRVIVDQGYEKDLEYRFGVVEKDVVDPETGLVETARGIDAEAVKKREHSDYARMFDKWNENWEPSHRQNIFYLNSVIQRFENVLRLRGYVLLNEVYEAMGYEPTHAGSQVGWIRGSNETGEGDGYISFGLEKNTENAVKFMNGTFNDVIIDPNVDGVITHKFKKV